MVGHMCGERMDMTVIKISMEGLQKWYVFDKIYE